jgi:hypothetical protein
MERVIDSETTLNNEKEMETDIENKVQDIVLIGTVYKEMKLRGSILDEFKDLSGVS